MRPKLVYSVLIIGFTSGFTKFLMNANLNITKFAESGNVVWNVSKILSVGCVVGCIGFALFTFRVIKSGGESNKNNFGVFFNNIR
jgi:hypothetical protein